MTHSYGRIKDTPDSRDYKFTPRMAFAVPGAVDLRPSCPPVYDQLQANSCIGNAIAGGVDYEREHQGPETPFMTPARLFIYYNARALEGTVDTDSGASIRDGFKSIKAQGVCAEYRWPYIVPGNVTRKPFHGCYGAASWHKTLTYLAVAQAQADMLDCLAQGYPFVFGITVYPSFETPYVDRTGFVPMPSPDEQAIGDHALLAVGYDVAAQRITFRNSWGTGWGDGGYGTIPFAYLTNPDLASDLWTIRLQD
jgi:C1A family cysteine protease